MIRIATSLIYSPLVQDVRRVQWFESLERGGVEDGNRVQAANRMVLRCTTPVFCGNGELVMYITAFRVCTCNYISGFQKRLRTMVLPTAVDRPGFSGIRLGPLAPQGSVRALNPRVARAPERIWSAIRMVTYACGCDLSARV